MRPRKVEDIAEVLRLKIRGRTYGSAERLPSERELAVELGVARSTLRQALGVLMDEGYLVRRLGAKGGWFVTDLAQPVARWTEASRGDLRKVRDIIDYRIAVETRAAELAAERRTEERLVELVATVDELRAMFADGWAGTVDPHMAGRLRSVDDRFHRLIADAADSALVQEAVAWARAELFAVESRSTYREIGGRLPHDHQDVVDAIARQEPAGARAAMEEHIRHGAEVWLTTEAGEPAVEERA